MLTSVIYNNLLVAGIDLDFHDSKDFKFFTFSNIIFSKFEVTKNGINSIDGTINFQISSPDSKLLRKIIDGFIKNNPITINGNDFTMTNIVMLKEPKFTNKMEFRTMSPIVVNSHKEINGEVRKWDLSPDDKNFFHFIERNLIKKYNQMLSLSLFEGNQAKIMSIFYDILHKLSSYSNVNKTIMPAISFIEKNFPNPNLKNQDLANECNISEVYFRKLFTKHFGISPKQFIVDLRIKKAKQLLIEGMLSVSYISEKCGFSNTYHFCRLFKEHTGTTPTEYRKEHLIYKI
jgi:CRISPR-associated endoribonuclease Cas6